MKEFSRLNGALEFGKMLASGGIRLDPLQSAPSIADVRKLAKRRLPRMAFDIVDGAANYEVTAEENISDLARVRFRPRWLTDISSIDTRTELDGSSLKRPFVMGPCGLMRMLGGNGELDAVKAAGAADIPFTISSASNWSMEELADVATGPLWFQLYMYRNERVVRNLVTRAKNLGVRTLVITVDVPINGTRYRDHRNGMSIPPKITPSNAASAVRHPSWTRAVMRPPAIGFRNLLEEVQGSNAVSHQEFVNKHLANLSLTWDSIAQVRRLWDGPMYIKGILTSEDALRALRVGADGIYVSNHGGRQLDSSPSAISSLPQIVDKVDDRLSVIFDSGVRSGADVTKALAMGADAVSIGRAWAYGNAAAGGAGVSRVLEILDAEFEQTLGMLGCPRAVDLSRGFVQYPQEWHGDGIHREPEDPRELHDAEKEKTA